MTSIPSIKLVECFGPKAMKQAWVTSRPTMNYESNPEVLERDLRGIMNVDLPISGFYVFSLEIEGSILFRDLMFTLRPINPWAQSNRMIKRTYDNTNFDVVSIMFEDDSKEFDKTLSYFEESRRYQVETEEKLDIKKRYLPLMTMTKWNTTVDYRSLMSFIKTLMEVDINLFRSYGIALLRATLVEVPTHKHFALLDDAGLEKAFEKFPNRSIYEKLALPNKYFESTYGEVERNGSQSFTGVSSFELSTKIASTLGGQFIRQHFSSIRWEAWNILKKFGYSHFSRLNCTWDSHYVALGYVENLKQLVSRRTCWIAQIDWEDSNSWSSVLSDLVKKMTDKEFVDTLPCRGCARGCTISEETRFRLYKNKPEFFKGGVIVDENPPCPILIEDPSMIELRESAYGSDSTIFDRWKSMDIKDNPNNEDRLFYEGN